ncbi:MAG: hypothetical protein M3Q69_21280 [Acidobacteriota bacterium]|nr:hypothetical protein [Acidobacteriota bacterium]
MAHDQESAPRLNEAQVKQLASEVAQELRAAGSDGVTPALRTRFIQVRAALFERGMYDPVLVRFDSATVAKASVEEIAEQLQSVSDAL